MEKRIRIGIIEDHKIVLEGLRSILKESEKFEVVFASSTGGEGLRNALELKPDIVLLDVRLPDEPAVKIAEKITSNSSCTKIICISSFDSLYEITELMRAGISAYVLKDTTAMKLFKIIEMVNSGGTYIDERLTFKLFEIGQNKTGNVITPREAQIIYLASLGKTNKEIAYDLKISEDTVKTHISKIIKKLGASNRTEAVVIAIRDGIISEYIAGKDAENNGTY
jgi:DNA-binding NarL/FixJ family response regulator